MHGRAIHGVVVGPVGPEGALSAHIRPWAGLGAYLKYIFDSDKELSPCSVWRLRPWLPARPSHWPHFHLLPTVRASRTVPPVTPPVPRTLEAGARRAGAARLSQGCERSDVSPREAASRVSSSLSCLPVRFTVPRREPEAEPAGGPPSALPSPLHGPGRGGGTGVG